MLALGYTEGILKKLFREPGPLEKSKSQTEPLLYSTRLYFECRIARTLGMTYEQYRQLPRRERQLWYYFHILEQEKEAYAYEKAKKDAETNAKPSHQPHMR